MPTIASKSEVKEDLKSLPLPELQEKLGSSPDGLSQAEAQHRLAQYGLQRDCREENQSVPEISLLFLGSDPVDD